MPRKVSEDEVERMKFLKEEGLTYREIAEEFGFSRSTVSKYLVEGTRTEVTPEMVEEMKELRKDGYTYKEIADEIGTAAITVGNYMREAGLGGKKKVTQEMVQRMKNLDGIGMSKKEIAERLDLSTQTIRKYLKEKGETAYINVLLLTNRYEVPSNLKGESKSMFPEDVMEHQKVGSVFASTSLNTNSNQVG